MRTLLVVAQRTSLRCILADCHLHQIVYQHLALSLSIVRFVYAPLLYQPYLFWVLLIHNRRNSFTTHLGFMSQMPTEEEECQRRKLSNYGRPAYVE